MSDFLQKSRKPTKVGKKKLTTDNRVSGNVTNLAGVLIGKTTPVGSYSPNPWGLYDLEGNVFERCSDWSGPYAAGDQIDPQGAPSGVRRVCRGGAFGNIAVRCRSAARATDDPGTLLNNLGIRLVLARNP